MDVRIKKFQSDVYSYYRAHQRSLLWRESKKDGSFDAYHIIVSELMLQQTQVARVIPKYQAFVKRFPTIDDLARASLADVLILWSGLGYNRRARFLHVSAQYIVAEYGGEVPRDIDNLVSLPGIGPNTAAAIMAYSFNMPVVFIETNIRTVFLHHFFPGQTDVSDKQLVPLITDALDRNNPREWYWALMDYGTYLKQTYPNPNRRSKHYTKQTAFAGSKRFIRGRVLKILTQQPAQLTKLQTEILDERLNEVLKDLVADGLISQKGHTYELAK